MREKDLDKKVIKSAIKERIAQGEPKQKILEDLSAKYKNNILIMRLLENTPSLERKMKYLTQNLILSILLLITLGLDLMILTKPNKFVFDFIFILNVLNVVLDAIFLYGVKTYKIEVYNWIGSRAVASLILIVVSLSYYNQSVDVLAYVTLGLVTVSFALGWYLAMELCPRRVPTYKEVSVNDKETVVKRVYMFPD